MDNREKIIHELEIKLVPIFDMETVTRISALLRTLNICYKHLQINICYVIL